MIDDLVFVLLAVMILPVWLLGFVILIKFVKKKWRSL